MQVDLNCDMGESFGPWTMGDDSAMLELITSANVACGFHGGDPQIMLKTAKLAKEKGVAIGAHPGFHDIEGFGRRPIQGLSAREIETLVAYQIGALQGIAALAGHRVTYVKIHGALSNMACEDEMMANALAAAIKGVDPSLAFVVLPFSKLVGAGEKAGLAIVTEVFADRAYEDSGLLVSRRKPGAVLHDPEFRRPARQAHGRGAGHHQRLRQGEEDRYRHGVHPRRHAGGRVARESGAPAPRPGEDQGLGVLGGKPRLTAQTSSAAGTGCARAASLRTVARQGQGARSCPR